MFDATIFNMFSEEILGSKADDKIRKAEQSQHLKVGYHLNEEKHIAINKNRIRNNTNPKAK